jgi:hypothetical protein
MMSAIVAKTTVCQRRVQGNVQPFELEGETRLILFTVINRRPGKFKTKFNDIISQEEHKPFSAA